MSFFYVRRSINCGTTHLYVKGDQWVKKYRGRKGQVPEGPKSRRGQRTGGAKGPEGPKDRRGQRAGGAKGLDGPKVKAFFPHVFFQMKSEEKSFVSKSFPFCLPTLTIAMRECFFSHELNHDLSHYLV